jgi:hypothetical protein
MAWFNLQIPDVRCLIVNPRTIQLRHQQKRNGHVDIEWLPLIVRLISRFHVLAV